MNYRSVIFILFLHFSALCPGSVWGYPLDGSAYTHIKRLEGYYFSLRTPSGRRTLQPGAYLAMDQVFPRLLDWQKPLPKVDRLLQREIVSLLGKNAPGYSVALLDVSKLSAPRYAEHNADRGFIPGSVGKVVAALAVFDSLAKLYPEDLSKREEILRETIVVADEFIQTDSHEVPFWHPHLGTIELRALRVGDRANLWTYLDWMLSASSNAAASMVMKHIILIRHFGKAYPPSLAEEEAFFFKTSRQELTSIFSRAMTEAVSSNGLSTGSLGQASFFTASGKRMVPSRGSHATARELLRFLLLMEQGRLVDEFSSRELKRLLYSTQARIRYAASPVLDQAAIYFKSGSLYRCRPEPGYRCRKYEGNALNQLTSVAVLEYPAYKPLFRYLIVVSSNVLRQNADAAHRNLAGKIHRLIERYHREQKPAERRSSFHGSL